jgi:hypothetical protein
MGYGEFGGTGSVDWRVRHSNGRRHNDRDEDTATIIGVFINGVKIAEVDAKTSRVLVVWGFHLAPDQEPNKKNVRMEPLTDEELANPVVSAETRGTTKSSTRQKR